MDPNVTLTPAHVDFSLTRDITQWTGSWVNEANKKNVDDYFERGCLKLGARVVNFALLPFAALGDTIYHLFCAAITPFASFLEGLTRQSGFHNSDKFKFVNTFVHLQKAAKAFVLDSTFGMAIGVWDPLVAKEQHESTFDLKLMYQSVNKIRNQLQKKIDNTVTIKDQEDLIKSKEILINQQIGDHGSFSDHILQSDNQIYDLKAEIRTLKQDLERKEEEFDTIVAEYDEIARSEAEHLSLVLSDAKKLAKTDSERELIEMISVETKVTVKV